MFLTVVRQDQNHLTCPPHQIAQVIKTVSFSSGYCYKLPKAGKKNPQGKHLTGEQGTQMGNYGKSRVDDIKVILFYFFLQNIETLQKYKNTIGQYDKTVCARHQHLIQKTTVTLKGRMQRDIQTNQICMNDLRLGRVTILHLMAHLPRGGEVRAFFVGWGVAFWLQEKRQRIIRGEHNHQHVVVLNHISQESFCFFSSVASQFASL